MKPSIVIDPGLLAIPNTASTTEEAEELLARAIDWAQFAFADSPIQIVQSPDTASLLQSHNFFPSGDNIRALIELFNLNHVFTVNDVRTAINFVLTRSHSTEAVLGCTVSRVQNATVQPDILSEYGVAGLRTLGEHFIGNLLSNNVTNAIPADLCFGASGVLSTYPADYAAAADIEGNFADDGPYFIQHVANNVKLVHSVESFFRRLSAGVVWDNAETAEDVHAAIILEAVAIEAAGGNQISIVDVPRFSVGSEFLQSLLDHQSGPSSKFGPSVRECCARVVLGKPKQPARRQFKTAASKSAGNKDEMRDGAFGMRVHVAKHHEALRLLYWQEKTHVEFANVGVKGEIQIHRGTPTRCVAESLCRH